MFHSTCHCQRPRFPHHSILTLFRQGILDIHPPCRSNRHYFPPLSCFYDTFAHACLAQACLGILLHLDEDVTSDSLEDFHLAQYAAEHWSDHAPELRMCRRNVEDGMKQLFDPSKPHLAVCVWICDPAVPIWNRMTRNETPLPLRQTSLHYAASWGLHSVVEFLIIEHSQDVCSGDTANNLTPLHLASFNGHAKAACKLIERGADTTAQDNSGATPLNLALETGQVDVVRILIERGADLTARNNKGSTPLHLASQKGDVDIARMLIESGADLTSQNNIGSTPLHLASLMGNVDVARMLIESGADVTAQMDSQWTPLHLASYWGRVDFAHMLIECGADVTAQIDDEETPLHLALHRGQVDTARMLIEHCMGRTDAAAQNNDEETPLHLALQQGKADIACMLIERGVDLTTRNNHGSTSLHLALYWGQVDIARMLIERGADATAQNNHGLTPLHYAVARGYRRRSHAYWAYSDALYFANIYSAIPKFTRLFVYSAIRAFRHGRWRSGCELAPQLKVRVGVELCKRK